MPNNQLENISFPLPVPKISDPLQNFFFDLL